MHVDVLRPPLAAAAALAATWLLTTWAGDLVGSGLARVDDVVALATAVGGAAVAAWYAVTALALTLAQGVRLSRRAPRFARALSAATRRFGAPVLRRAAVVGAGAGLALGALPASAGVPDDGVPHDLRPGLTAVGAPGGWDAPSSAPPADDGASEPIHPSSTPAPTPPARTPAGGGATAPARAGTTPGADAAARDAPRPGGSAGGTRTCTAGTLPTAAPEPRPSASESAGGTPAPVAGVRTADSYEVRPGDSLWTVAATHLGPGARDADIAAEWPRWYTTNRAVVGADPDLIHPGQVLRAPEPKDAS